MVEHVRRQSGRRAVPALADAALERLASVVRLDVDFQMVAARKFKN
jgi:hypothetical protein